MRSLSKMLAVIILLLVASMLLNTGKFFRTCAEEVTKKATDREEELTVLRDEMNDNSLPVLDGMRKVVVLEKNKPKASNGSNPATATDNVRELSPIIPTKKLQEPLQTSHSLLDPTSATLSRDVIDGIKKFVFFVGYSRSGHSIVGTLMDAHPHVIIPHEYSLFQRFDNLNRAPKSSWRDNLYNILYRKSIWNVDHFLANTRKGYALGVDGLWQGKYDRYIEVIGDKSGGMTTIGYMENKQKFLRNYQKLKEEVKVPLRIIHVLRNPYDMFATHMVMGKIGEVEFARLKAQSPVSKVQIPDDKFEKITRDRFKQFSTAVELIRDVFGEDNVLTLHNSDMVREPRKTLEKLFAFLGVSATEQYFSICADKIYSSPSRSRDLMAWSPEQRESVQKRMEKYEMLNRYNFTSD